MMMKETPGRGPVEASCGKKEAGRNKERSEIRSPGAGGNKGRPTVLSPETYKQLFNSIQDALVYLDRDGVIREVNRKAVRLFGGTKRELLGRHFTEIGIFSPEEAKTLTGNFRQAMSGKSSSITFSLRNKKGREIVLDCSWSLIKEGGRVQGLAVIARDVTARKKQEDLLRSSEERLKILFEFAPDAYYLSDTKGRFLDGNRVAEALTGYKREELIGKNFLRLELLPRRQVPKVTRLLARNLLGKPTGPHEFVLRRKDGSEVTVEIRTYPVRIDGKLQILGIARDVTERKKWEEALRESEQKYRVIVEQGHDAVFIYRGDRFLFVNSKAAEITGYSREELLERNIWTLLHPEDRERVKEIGRKRAEGKEAPARYTARFLTRTGEVRYGEFAVSRISFDGGYAALGAVRDITESLEAERKLRESEEKLRAIITGAHDAVIMVGGRQEVLFWNPAAERIFGYKEGEVIGKKLPAILAPGEFARAYENGFLGFETNRAGTAPGKRIELKAMRRDGTGFPVELSVSGVKIGEEQGIILIGRDISERVKAEEDRRLLAAAVEQTDEVVMVTDPEGRIEYINRAGKRAKEDIPGEAAGKRPEQIFRDGAKAIFSEARGTLNKGRSWSGQLKLKKKGRSPRLFQITAAPVLDGLGKVVRHVYVMRDVTREAALEAELRQAQKLEALGTLAGGVAHDFNNILTSIIGFTEMALDDAPPKSRLRSNLEEVFVAGKRGKDLVNQILAFSRRKEQEKSPIRVHLILKEALKLLRPGLSPTIRIQQDLRSEAEVLADPTQVYQMFMNLCTNAGDAMQMKGGVLEVRLEEVALSEDEARRHPDLRPGRFLKLTVRDTGCGMEKAVMDHIFEPYFTTKKQGRGTGMGLSVVHGIVKDLGGAITVSSRPGEGSTFQVFLPVHEPKTGKPGEQDHALPRGKESILLVDDDEQNVRVGKKILEDLGYRVTFSTNPRKALRTFRADPEAFDIAVVDVTMPGIPGDELAAKLLKVRPDLPVILCSGYNERMTRERARALGALEYILKPFDRSRFARTVRRILDQAGKGVNHGKNPGHR